MSIEKMYSAFRENAIIAASAFLQGDSKTNKAATKKMDNAFKKIEASGESMQAFYDVMVKDENAYVRLQAITYCGNTKFNIAWALMEIKKIRSDSELTDVDRLTINFAIDRWEKELKG